jgi:EF-hand domain pair/EF hand
MTSAPKTQNMSLPFGEFTVRRALAHSLPILLAIFSTHALAQALVAGDLFKKFDKNGDGAITPDEVSTAGNAGSGMTARGKPLQGKGAGQYEAMIKAVDKDGDGRITKAEAGDPPWFDKVDKNQDGVLDAGEINVLRDAMAKQAGDK